MNYSSEILNNLREKIHKHTHKVDTLSEYDMWSKHGVMVWEAENFTSKPFFYPVYRYKNYYSYSYLNLVLLKGTVTFEKDFVPKMSQESYVNAFASDVIDSEIAKIGGPHRDGKSICSKDQYASVIAEALRKDINDIEKLNQGYTNYVLCGGKDSLNLLLLPWNNKVKALSADPNFPLVKEFVENNNLGIEVIKLYDIADDYLLNQEVLEAFGRMDLSHWRWGGHLKEIAEKENGKLIFWKGQLADVYMAEKWLTYNYPSTKFRMNSQKIYKRLRHFLPLFVRDKVEHSLQKLAINTAWQRGSVMQGAHVAFIRQISDCLVLSAYHGPAMRNVLQEADLSKVANVDMRNMIGEKLLGRVVIYPGENPSPPPSIKRNGLTGFSLLKKQLEEGGIKVFVK